MNNWDFSVPADDFPEPMLLVSPDGEVLTLTYSLFDGNQEVANGTGIFERRRAESQ